MSYINSYNEESFLELKNYLNSFSKEELSNKIKDILSEESIFVLEELEDGKKISLCSFNNVINDYFEALEFSYNNYDDKHVQSIKKELLLFFKYLDSFDLRDTLKEKLIMIFFEKFENNGEWRGFYELITNDILRNSKIMKSFLDSDIDNKFFVFTKKLYKLFDTLNEEEIKKVNYVFLSSYEALSHFINSKKSKLDTYFNKILLDGLTKEELSVLFRTVILDYHADFFECDEDFFNMFIEMKKECFSKCGRSVEFIEELLNIFICERYSLVKNFCRFLGNYYKKYIKDKNFNFKEDLLFNELVFYIIECDGSLDAINNNCILNLEEFHECFKKEVKEKYEKAFFDGRHTYIGLNYGVLDNVPIFRKDYDKEVKSVYFDRVFGITYNQAKYLSKRYGTYIWECSDEMLSCDRDTLVKLKELVRIFNLNLDNEEEFKYIEEKFRDYVSKNGLVGEFNGFSYLIFRNKLDNMFLNTYKNILFSPDGRKPLRKARGIPVIDAGIKFNMIVNATSGVGEYFNIENGFFDKYNSSRSSGNVGICASFITNENLGVISLNGPLLGYCHLHDNTLDAMGIGDIYSCTEALSLKNSNDFLEGVFSNQICGRFYVTPNVLTDNTRFGYNEMLFDRFLLDDKENKFKVQPDYVVVYKFDDNYTKTRMYKKGLRMASEFGIPLVLVDVMKIKENEEKEILEMEEEVLNSSTLREDLIKEIIVRYMNNYTGSMIMTRSRNLRGNRWDYSCDFSEDGIIKFLNKLEKKLLKLDINEVNEYNKCLRDCYEMEKAKVDIAHDVDVFEHSLQSDEFLLDEINYLEKVDEIVRKSIDNDLYKNGYGLTDREIVLKEGHEEAEVIINLCDFFSNYSYIKYKDKGIRKACITEMGEDLLDEEKFAIGAVISYLIGDYKINYFSDLYKRNPSRIKFNMTNRSLESRIRNSLVFGDLHRSDFIVDLALSIYKLDIDSFDKLIEPVVSKYPDCEDVIYKRKQKLLGEVKKLPEKGKVKRLFGGNK